MARAPLTKKRRSRYDRPELATAGSALLARLVGKEFTRWGVPLTFMPRPGYAVSAGIGIYRVKGYEGLGDFTRSRDAVYKFFERNSPSRNHGAWTLVRRDSHWHFGNAVQHTVFLERPTRQDLADAMRDFRKHDSAPSHGRPNTLGWRTFSWDRKRKCLKSPSQGTLWENNELVADGWSDAAAVRGKAGIHACRLPRGDWKLADKPHDMPSGICVALVERFQRFVLGVEGWRAEWVIIKELLAPNAAVARTLRKLYPDIPVHVAHRHHWLNTERN